MNWTERFLVPGLAIAVAIGHAAYAGAKGLSAWKGGGFGMFSTIDTPGNRAIECIARLDDGEEVVVAFEGSGADLPLRRLRTLPMRADMEAIARRLMDGGLQEVDDQRCLRASALVTHEGGRPFPRIEIASRPRLLAPALIGEAGIATHYPVSVTVRLLRLDFDPTTATAEFVPLAAEEFHASLRP